MTKDEFLQIFPTGYSISEEMYHRMYPPSSVGVPTSAIIYDRGEPFFDIILDLIRDGSVDNEKVRKYISEGNTCIKDASCKLPVNWGSQSGVSEVLAEKILVERFLRGDRNVFNVEKFRPYTYAEEEESK